MSTLMELRKIAADIAEEVKVSKGFLHMDLEAVKRATWDAVVDKTYTDGAFVQRLAMQMLIDALPPVPEPDLEPLLSPEAIAKLTPPPGPTPHEQRLIDGIAAMHFRLCRMSAYISHDNHLASVRAMLMASENEAYDYLTRLGASNETLIRVNRDTASAIKLLDSLEQ